MAYASVPNVRGLVKQRRRYWYRAAVPEDVRLHFAGQSTHWENLQTDDLRMATARVHRAASDFRSRVLEARGRTGTVEEDALAWRRKIEEARTIDPDDTGRPDANDMVDFAIREAAKQYAKGGYAAVERSARLFHDGSEGDALLELGGPQAKTFVAIALEGRQPLAPFVAPWATHRATEVEPKTASMDKAAALRFVEAFPLASDVTSEAVADWIAKRRGDGFSGATVQREVSGLKAFWSWLQSRGEVPKDKTPLAGHRFKDRAKAKAAAKRQAFTPQEVAALHAAALKAEDQQLADLVAVLALTGLRREEACSLKVGDVANGWLSIKDAKSSAGWRSLPIAKPLAPVVRRLIAKRTAGYVFTGLDADRFGNRGDALGKRFTRLKTKLGHGLDKSLHSIRHTVQQALRAAGEHPDVISDILGHHVATVTGGIYGTPEARRSLLPAALAKLSIYPGSLKAPR